MFFSLLFLSYLIERVKREFGKKFWLGALFDRLGVGGKRRPVERVE